MKMEIDNKERELLTDLVQSRVSEIHPEIRRSMDHTFKDQLKQDLEQLERLLARLRSLDDSKSAPE